MSQVYTSGNWCCYIDLLTKFIANILQLCEHSHRKSQALNKAVYYTIWLKSHNNLWCCHLCINNVIGIIFIIKTWNFRLLLCLFCCFVILFCFFIFCLFRHKDHSKKRRQTGPFTYSVLETKLSICFRREESYHTLTTLSIFLLWTKWKVFLRKMDERWKFHLSLEVCQGKWTVRWCLYLCSYSMFGWEY